MKVGGRFSTQLCQVFPVQQPTEAEEVPRQVVEDRLERVVEALQERTTFVKLSPDLNRKY